MQVITLYPYEEWRFILLKDEKTRCIKVRSCQAWRCCRFSTWRGALAGTSRSICRKSVGEHLTVANYVAVGMKSFCASSRYIPYVKHPRDHHHDVTQYFRMYLSGFMYA